MMALQLQLCFAAAAAAASDHHLLLSVKTKMIVLVDDVDDNEDLYDFGLLH